jgi:5-methyltetrahydrofolate--homocysteine methyltransferase
MQTVREEVVGGDRSGVEAAVRFALGKGMPAARILSGGLIAAITEVGERFEKQEFYVPEMLVAARAMQAGLALLKPQLIESGVQAAGKVVLGPSGAT